MSDGIPTITDPFSTTALDEATELRALSQALRLAQGFKLIFVRCNQPQQRRHLIAALRAELPELNAQEIHFDKPLTHLLDELRGRIAEPPPDAVFVSGLEYSLPVAAEADATPLVANLNASRNSFPQVVPCPLLLWIPEYILNAIMLGAPDFFSIRSGVYFFAASPGETTEIARTLMAGAEWRIAGLSLTEKQQRIEAIKSLLADYESLPDTQRDYNTEVRLHGRLGNLFFATGNLSHAQHHYEHWLTLATKLESRDHECVALVSLGNSYGKQGRLDKAEDAYQRALVISRSTENRLSECAALSGLGDIYSLQERWDEAEKFYQQILAALRKEDDQAYIGLFLNHLGNLYYKQNRLTEAENFYQQSLQISREVGNRYSEGNTLINLGSINVMRGYLIEAEDYFQQSLIISRELDDFIEQAIALSNLGLICQQRGQLIEAESIYKESLEIYQKTDDRINQGDILIKLSRLWMELGDLTRALEFAQQAVEVLKTTDDVRRLAIAQELLATAQQAAAKQ